MKVTSAIWLVLLFLGTFEAEAGTCPPQATRQLRACLRGFSTVTDFTQGSLKASSIQQYCATRAAGEVQCIETVIENCRQSSPVVRRVLENIVDVNAIRNSIKIVCSKSNINILISSQTCLVQQLGEVRSCVYDALITYSGKLQSFRNRTSSKGAVWFRTKIYKLLCEYTDATATCKRPYRQNCGFAVGDLIDAFAESSKPPVCKAKKNAPNIPTRTVPFYTSPSSVPRQQRPSKTRG